MGRNTVAGQASRRGMCSSNAGMGQRSTTRPAFAHLPVHSGAAGVMLQSALRPSVVTLMGDGSEAM